MTGFYYKSYEFLSLRLDNVFAFGDGGGAASDPLDAVKAINFDPAKSGLWVPDNTFSDMLLTPTGAGDGIELALDTLNGAGYSSGDITGLGPELWDDDAAFVTGESQILGPGRYRVYSSTGESSAVLLPDGAVAPGKMYLARMEVESLTGSNIKIGNLGGSITDVGSHTETVEFNTTVANIKRGGVVDATISGISIREIPGNVIQQGSVALQPTRQTTPNNIMQFDGIQDYLPIPFDMSGERFVVAMAYHDPAGQGAVIAINDETSSNYAIYGADGDASAIVASGATLNNLTFDGVGADTSTRDTLHDDFSTSNVMIADITANSGWTNARVGIYAGAVASSPLNPAALLIMQVDAPLTDAENADVQTLMESYL